MISRILHSLCVLSSNIRTWHRKGVTGTCSRWFSSNRGSLYGLQVVRETNHTGSRKTNKHWTGAKKWLGTSSHFAVHFQCKLGGKYKKFFFLIYMCHSAEVLEYDKVQRMKEAAEAAQSKGTSALALVIFWGRQTQSHISGLRNQYCPQLQAHGPHSH